TVYLSDGKSGSTHTASSKMWNPFVEASHSGHNLIFVSLHGTNRYIRTVNAYGKIVDEFPRIFEQPVFEHALSTFLPKGGLTLSAEIAEFQGASYMATDYSGFSRGGFAQFNPEEGSGKVIWQLP